MSQPESASSTCSVCGAPLDPESSGGCPHCLMLAAMKATEDQKDLRSRRSRSNKWQLPFRNSRSSS